MVKSAKIAYRDFPTVVNEIAESGVTYNNTMADYARMDSNMQGAQKAIGGSSDSAQLAQSYMWTKVANREYDIEYWQLYHNTVILAVLAQVAIDGCKKVFEVDPNEDILRIRSQKCMNREKDYPKFMKYTHKIAVTKNGKERPIEDVRKERSKVKARIDESIVCPMNWLQECLDKIQGASRSSYIETSDFLAEKPDGKPKASQMGKIRGIVENFSAFVNFNMPIYLDEQDIGPILDKTNEVMDSIRGMKISQATIYRLIETSFGIEGRVNTDKTYKEATKYTRKMMNVLYTTNREKFLNCFKKNGFAYEN